ncbi:SdiA-regulated domain-containing protein [Mucilaginibacter myungsuensis]|uniref:SdiA-regulated domain-containing protein n=1 Tax=Mucilaginibacter myungsuensis TaxID=649104 RepID=A0A929PVF0_9SPHI|nr:SdiA-regulated domain-containing protein [Mucilaginibacter myungsuensis]MBE9660260.1 SdiA-regulated domain-containing protein [Mucilaginibacter myungsuensis]MDN3600302.1 SdiA-regulated domain-containing protein [Mucilaginibacter myungsuensis]
MKISSRLSIFTLSLFSFAGISCEDSRPFKSPTGYDLTKPVKYNMPERLTEISGIAFQNGKDDLLYAEEDETGRVYYFKLGEKDIQHTEFGKDGDYEDIAVLNSKLIMMRSDATFFVFPLDQVKLPKVDSVTKIDKALPKGEYEGMYADAKTNRVYVLCKSCSADKHNKTTSGYIMALTPDGGLQQTGEFSIDIKQITDITGQKKLTFRPSAITKNNKTGEWFILSSVNKALVIADENWKVKGVYVLDPSLFNQPEGMAFDSAQNLYISNEGDEITPGNVLKFNYQK